MNSHVSRSYMVHLPMLFQYPFLYNGDDDIHAEFSVANKTNSFVGNHIKTCENDLRIASDTHFHMCMHVNCFAYMVIRSL